VIILSIKHGIYISENPTSASAPIIGGCNIVVVGTAMINQGEVATPLEPKLAYTLEEAVKKVGPIGDFSNFTISEAVSAAFEVYGVSPIIMINVLDPATHKESTTNANIPISNGIAILDDNLAILSSVVVTSGAQTCVKDIDYTIGFEKEKVKITAIPTSTKITSSTTKLSVTYDKIKPSLVTNADVKNGIQKIKQVFPKFGLTLGMLLAPKYSQLTEIYNSMKAVVNNLNGMFNLMFLAYIPTATTVDEYTEINAWKNSNGFTDKRSAVFWPKAKISDKQYFLGTLVAMVAAKVDAENDGVPFVSPSNKDLGITGLCLDTGAEVLIDLETANVINSYGVVTALNMNGFKSWGNYTAAYPSSTDVKDMFIAVRRMFDWWANSFILTYWQKVDSPMNRRLIESIVDSENMKAGGYKARFQIADAKIEYNAEDNPETDLLAGKIRFKQYLSPYLPAQAIENVLEYDVTAFTQSLV